MGCRVGRSQFRTRRSLRKLVILRSNRIPERGAYQLQPQSQADAALPKPLHAAPRASEKPCKRRRLRDVVEDEPDAGQGRRFDTNQTGGREAITGRPKPGSSSVLLFYQYVEPPWSSEQHKTAIEWAKESGARRQLSGRMRVAREGFNCTLTGTAQNIRRWCRDLRAFSPFFIDTEFKIEDGLPKQTGWASLDVIQAEELVVYGLAGDKAPPLSKGGTHLEPHDYHAKLQEPGTVVVDVRNSYEADIGRFAVERGADYINPQMRRSTDWPSWLRQPETQEKLKGKQVMMFCTGGIRCERASSLLNHQMGDQLRGVYQLQGGIDKYLKTFPDGGHWVGKNYTFDKRREQEAESRRAVISACLACGQPWDDYRQQRRCATCGVPVLVCASCASLSQCEALQCKLCAEQGIVNKGQYRREEKRRNEEAGKEVLSLLEHGSSRASGSPGASHVRGAPAHCTRLFISHLNAQAVDEATMLEAFPGVTHIQWLKDKDTGRFYGSCFVEMRTPGEAANAVKRNGTALLGKRVKVKYAPMDRTDRWPPYGSAVGRGGPNTNGPGPPPFPKCRKFFVRGVAEGVQDGEVRRFFLPSVVTATRWMTHRDSGKFRGCGHVEFASPEDAQAAAARHGTALAGKVLSLDWAT